MQISPINYKTNPTFQAVNQKYLQRAQKEFAKRKGVTGDLLDCISIEAFFKQISKQDAIDTLNAIKQYAENAIGPWKSTLEFIKKLNQ